MYADKWRWVLAFLTLKYPTDRYPTRIAGFRLLPAFKFVELLSHFGDPHFNIRREKTRRVHLLKHVERQTVTRKLTMACWHLRNAFLPFLREYVEGCGMIDDQVPPYPFPFRLGSGTNAEKWFIRSALVSDKEPDRLCLRPVRMLPY